MHIIPAALLDDGRKLVCEWLFLSASPVFHMYFDGPDTAPHIQVRVMERSPSCDGLVDFTVEVNTRMVGADTFIFWAAHLRPLVLRGDAANSDTDQLRAAACSSGLEVAAYEAPTPGLEEGLRICVERFGGNPRRWGRPRAGRDPCGGRGHHLSHGLAGVAAPRSSSTGVAHKTGAACLALRPHDKSAAEFWARAGFSPMRCGWYAWRLCRTAAPPCCTTWRWPQAGAWTTRPSKRSSSSSKLANSFDLQKPDIGYQTFVKVPEAQADHFERAVKWRCACVEAAWARKSQGHPVSITGDHVWWQLLELPAELQVAVGEAKKAAGIGAEVDTDIEAAVD